VVPGYWRVSPIRSDKVCWFVQCCELHGLSQWRATPCRWADEVMAEQE